MDTIRNYVDMMFKDLPKTKVVIDMKMNILDNMEDKFNELLSEGKTENEAIGAVISQFGNIDELKDELGFAKETREGSDNLQETMIPYKDDKEVLRYLHHKVNFGYALALGVAFCILSVVPPCFEHLERIGTLFFFMMVATGVAIIIVASLRSGEYEEFEKQPFQIREPLKEKLTNEYERFRSFYGIGIALGVVLCILSPMGYLTIEYLGEFMYSGTHAAIVSNMENWFEGFASASLFILVAIGVAIFISLGTKRSAYEYILQNDKKRLLKKQEEEDDHISGFVMSIAGILYLIIGFAFGMWHPGWLIFPIAALFASGFSQLRRNRNS